MTAFITRRAYFDAGGKLLLLLETGTIMEPPPTVVFVVPVPDDAHATTIYYDVEAGEVKFRAQMPLTITRNRVEGVPAGSLVIYPDGDHIVDDGLIEIEQDVEGQLRLYIDHPHYLPAQFTLEVGP